MQKKLIIFIPSIEGGGVEKNLFIISNYLKKKLIIFLLLQFQINLKINLIKKLSLFLLK